jgi:hypothetical protein
MKPLLTQSGLTDVFTNQQTTSGKARRIRKLKLRFEHSIKLKCGDKFGVRLHETAFGSVRHDGRKHQPNSDLGQARRIRKRC